jgi:hypothetical protein
MHIAGTCPKILYEYRKRFIAIMIKRPTEGPFVFDAPKTRE